MTQTTTRRGLLGHAAGAATAALLIRSAVASPVAPADPLLVFVQDWQAAMAGADQHIERIPTDKANAYWHSHVGPFFERVQAGDLPAATTSAGAAAALRRVLDFGDIERPDEMLVRAALAFLEREV